ncbi:unnamed protein product [Symbiodinium sp. CCMP2592]|nr:unnamed protein product [Symbiodinium sp. CCMP2592]
MLSVSPVWQGAGGLTRSADKARGPALFTVPAVSATRQGPQCRGVESRVSVGLVASAVLLRGRKHRLGRTARTASAGSLFLLPDGRDIRVLTNEGEVKTAVAAEVASCSSAAIAEKGAFSICVPGSFGPADGQELAGAQLIGESLATLSGQGMGFQRRSESRPKKSVQLTADFDKWHVFFAGERLDGQESFLLAKKLWIDSCGIPEAQVHPVPQGMPAEGAAAQYTAEICMQDESILVDSDQGLPALDLLLLDMAKDGTIGRLKPDSPEVEEAGSGKVILPVEDDDAEAAIAAPDFMNAARTAVIVATGAAAAASVNKALGSASSACPASLIRTGKTIWLLDAGSAQDVSEP